MRRKWFTSTEEQLEKRNHAAPTGRGKEVISRNNRKKLVTTSQFARQDERESNVYHL
jgi:predicted kinase